MKLPKLKNKLYNLFQMGRPRKNPETKSKKLEPLVIKKRTGNPLVIFKGIEREMTPSQIEYAINKYGEDSIDLQGNYTPKIRGCADC